MNIPADKLKEMQDAFLEIAQPRPDYVLRNMVVWSRFTEAQQYAQCVLEMSIKYDNLRTAELQVKLKELEVKELDTDDEKDQLNKQIKEIEMEQTNRARLWALREFNALFKMWQEFPKKYTRWELNEAQEEEYKHKLEIQAQQDLNATGRISVWNQEGLRQIWKMTYPQLDITRDVEQRFLEDWKQRMLIAVPTEFKAENWLPCLEWVDMPAWVEIKIFNCYERKVAEAYNEIIRVALEDKVDYLVTVEDDTFPQADAIVKLLELLKKNPKSAVWAYYVKKEESRQWVHIEMVDWKREQMKDDWTVKEAYTMAMWCSIYPIELLMQLRHPYCVTTKQLTQDSFFSQLIREAWWKLLVDTNIKCKHKCRITWKVYE